MSSTVSADSIKLYSIPKLKADGSNWVQWKELTTSWFASKSLRRHVAGTVRPPPEPSLFDAKATYSEDQLAQLDAEEKKWDEYDQKENMVKQQIYATVSESILLKVMGKGSAAETWKAPDEVWGDSRHPCSSRLHATQTRGDCCYWRVHF